MKKLITTFALFAIWINYSFACSCVMSKPDFMLFASNETIFTGKIIAIEHSTIYTDKVTFKVYKMFKGMKNDTTLTISTNAGSGMCGINGKVGEKFLIFANPRKGILSTDICMHSGRTKSCGKELSMLRSISRIGSKWYEDNNLVAIGKTEGHIPIGNWKFFRKGRLTSEGNYTDGQQNGDWIIYYKTKEGKVVPSSVKYEKGERIEKAVM